eukprot:11882220-Ditylum_brightwellii.AAC.1
MYEQSANGAEFICPDQAISLALVLLGIVDDDTNQVNMFTDNGVTISQLLSKMKEDIQLWLTLLLLTGGLLELTKCSYHVINFLFYPDETLQMQLQQPVQSLRIEEGGGR